MARVGRSAAALKKLRKRFHLGEYSRKSKTVRATKKRRQRRRNTPKLAAKTPYPLSPYALGGYNYKASPATRFTTFLARTTKKGQTLKDRFYETLQTGEYNDPYWSK